MSDPIGIIAAICNEMNNTGHAHSPRIELKEEFDFDGFTKQKSGFEGVEYEWVRQAGPHICDDDYHSTVAIPIDAQYLFVIQCDT
tara:strand:+ start:937 stop:1191 length:255 start_codon:yes stop_codon:yes gene_type:complete